MGKFLVAGITEIETIVNVEKVPVDYSPLTFMPNSIFTAVGGDAYNETIALTALGNQVKFISEVGKEQDMGIFNPKDSEILIPLKYVEKNLKATPAAVIFCDNQRNSQVFEDIKDLRDSKYDMTHVPKLIGESDLVVISNANFCRPIVKEATKQRKPIAVNIRAFNRDKEKYNKDFLKAADILYVSDDTIDEDPYDFAKEMSEKYSIEIVIIGQGKEGVIIFDRETNMNVHYNAVKTAKVVNTAGAGNALFSCFLHYYVKTGDSTMAIKNALLFASYKIGFVGTSYGILTLEQLDQWRNVIWNENNPFEELSAEHEEKK